MKALKLQCCDAGKPSKAISSNRAAYERASLVLATVVTFLALLLCLIPMVAASTSESAAKCGQPIVHARTVITDGIVADYPFHGYLFLPGGVPAVGDTVWVVNEARTDSLACVTDDDGRYENDPLTSVPDAYQGLSLRAFPNPDPRTLVFESPDKTSGGAQLGLYDVQGREVTSAERIPAGAYVARAVMRDGKTATVKVMSSENSSPNDNGMFGMDTLVYTAKSQFALCCKLVYISGPGVSLVACRIFSMSR